MNKKLKRHFRAEVLKYQSWVINHGYASGDPMTLLWYFNHKGKAFKNGSGYYILYKDHKYCPDDIILYFTNNNGKI